jgi:hypothetical protein
MGAWDKTDGALSLQLDSTKTTADPAMFTIQSVSVVETNASPMYKVAMARFVSGPMLAQNLKGTIQIMAGVLAEDVALAGVAPELYYALHVWVTKGDTSDLRGTLLNNYSELASSNNPFPLDPKGRDLMVTAALNEVGLLAGDRIVVEVGYIARNAVASDVAGTLYYGTDYYSNGSPDMVRD